MNRLRKVLPIGLLLLLLLLVGCEPVAEERLKVCAGLLDSDRAIGRLQANAAGLQSFRVSSGKCHAQFYENGKKRKVHSENFGVKLWVNPPNEIRMQGSIFVDNKGLILGANDREFWFSIKPELSTYIWGRWSEQENPKALLINPATMLEAFGAIEIKNGQQWQLTNEGAFDVLTHRTSDGELVKRIYVYCCDYRTRKLIYYDAKSQPAVICELDDYVEVAEGFQLPSKIKLITFNKEGDEEFFDITFKSIKPYAFTSKMSKALFTRRDPRGFKNVYRLAHGEVVEESK